ncbi:hypothetical protein [Aureimonas mangrovi]|uniref:hypothetical protein n=1 Tax=Aureimonas mangrovi TaxID=2758041 RepID=UPI00163DC620|nr:hypothetical protein [Aureimonas mangrovi]
MADERKRNDHYGLRETFRQRWHLRRPIRSSDILVGMALAALAIVLIVRSAARLLSLA